MGIAVLVANIVAAVAAVVAIIVAIVIYFKSAKLQTKAINYSLLESRIRIWKYFEHDKNTTSGFISRVLEGREWELERFKLLFSEDAVRKYERIVSLEKELNDLKIEICSIERDSFSISDENGNPDDNECLKYQKLKTARGKVLEEKYSDKNWVDFEDAYQQISELYRRDKYVKSVKDYLQKKKELSETNQQFLELLQNEVKETVKE